MSKHTPEPWVLLEVGDRHSHFCPASEKDKTSILTVTEESGTAFAAVYSEADARRIVACVNACAGVPTDMLESSAANMLELSAARANCAKWGIEAEKAKQQRDELLAALEEGRRAIGEHFAPNDCYATGPMTGNEFRDLVQCPACSFIAMYDDVIAKVKGGAA